MSVTQFAPDQAEIPRGLVFGIPLDEAFKNMGIDDSKGLTQDDVPSVLSVCCQYIEEKGMAAEGIFRLPGSTRLVRDAKYLLDSGRLITFENNQVHAVTSLLKLWFRELPEPLLTFALYDDFIKTQGTCTAFCASFSGVPLCPLQCEKNPYVCVLVFSVLVFFLFLVHTLHCVKNTLRLIPNDVWKMSRRYAINSHIGRDSFLHICSHFSIVLLPITRNIR